LQENVRGEFGAAHAFGPVFNGAAKKASETTFSVSWLDINSLQESARSAAVASRQISEHALAKTRSLRNKCLLFE
jgi:hypothetical protein